MVKQELFLLVWPEFAMQILCDIHQDVDVIVLRKEHGTDWYLK